MVNKKINSFLKQIIGVTIFVMLIISFCGCATTEEKETRNRINEHLRNKSNESLTSPPLEGETVLKYYQSRYQAFNNIRPNSYIVDELNRDKSKASRYARFSYSDAARRLLEFAVNEFPDIPLEEMEVRSLTYNDQLFNYDSLGPAFFDVKITAPSRYDQAGNITMIVTYPFSGAVVRVKR